MAWIQTYTGKKFYPLNPRAEDICIEDIAHALSMICRYNGHCKFFYSVAEHCILISDWLPGEYKLHGLLHDAAEAYLCDLTSPIKREMPIYKEKELELQMMIESKLIDYDGFGFVHENVKKADIRILMDERVILFDNLLEWGTDCKPLGVELMLYTPEEAEMVFVERFNSLTGGM